MGKDFKSMVTRCIYVGKENDNAKKLKTMTEELRDLHNNVMKRVKMYEDQQKLKRLEKVQVWLRQSDAAIKEAEEMLMMYVSSSSSSNGSTVMISSSHKVDKKICKMLKEVQEIKSRGTFDVVVENSGVVVGGGSMMVSTVDRDDQTVGLEAVSGLVWRCLTVDNTGIIGLYGVEGVGKTTVLTQVNNRLLQHKSNGFDFVIWVFVSKNLNLEKIQDTIREKIGFLDRSWTSKTEEERAGKIFEILSKKRFALFLDDVWEKVDLVKAGVPSPDGQNRSKIVFTTCSDEVCREMGTQTKIKMEKLPWERAWDLFKKNAGEETVKSHPDITKVAQEVAAKCEGLPLALVTIGRAMASKKTPQEWRDALYILSNSPPNFSVLKLLDRN
ncbi:Disease resistance protein (NBS class) family [Raphanus sativus]|uniref:Disease resistance protein At3g15700 isoform X2 n=1 Tax=Raphanus sativus TaxID=3726 RepID=A0A9W3CM91_RAPSA|nr:putative disease resistance protein At3g15700 isoform X2 [Raphanus sativus]KAJ4872477.1 Disease resistance protein (NBS class) family [Raphanus sativus]